MEFFEIVQEKAKDCLELPVVIPPVAQFEGVAPNQSQQRLPGSRRIFFGRGRIDCGVFQVLSRTIDHRDFTAGTKP